MTIGDRSDHLMHHLRDRREAAGAAIEDAAARVWADPAQLARLIDDAETPLSLYWEVLDVVVHDDEVDLDTEGPVPTAQLEAGIRAGRLDALPADVRDRLARYVRERVAARLGL